MKKEYKEIQLLIKKYLSLENVNFLTGAGTSFHLGAPVIREVPEGLKEVCKKSIEKYFQPGLNP